MSMIDIIKERDSLLIEVMKLTKENDLLKQRTKLLEDQIIKAQKRLDNEKTN